MATARPGSKRFDVTRAQIDAMANALSYDPLAFADLEEKVQVETILRIMPLEVSAEEMIAAVGDARAEAQGADTAGMNPLESIKAIEKAIYAARRDANVAADTQAKHAAELERTLGPAAPDGSDWTAEATRIRAEKEAIETAERAGLAGVNAEFRKTKEAAIATRTKDISAIDGDIDAKIVALNHERASRRSAAADAETAAIESAPPVCHQAGRGYPIRQSNHLGEADG